VGWLFSEKASLGSLNRVRLWAGRLWTRIQADQRPIREVSFKSRNPHFSRKERARNGATGFFSFPPQRLNPVLDLWRGWRPRPFKTGPQSS
jgi:hypothetical protein